MQRVPFSIALATLVVLPACGGGGGSSAFEVHTSRYTGTSSPLLLQREGWAVFLASESQSDLGSLNGATTLPVPDSDTTDNIAIAVRLSNGEEFATGISPRSVELLSNSLYFAVDESLDVDWNLNSVVENVLLRFSPTLAAPEVVDVARFDGSADVVRAGNRIWYVADTAPLGADETNLRYIEAGAPTTPLVVSAKGSTFGMAEVFLLGQSNGLVFCAIDENTTADLNGDSDTDDLILAVLDATATLPVLVSTDMAISDVDSPFLARPLAVGQWRVLFLVDEASQGTASLNDRNAAPFTSLTTWNPSPCTGTADTDTLDRVLHTFDWNAGDIVALPPTNTGISSMATTGDERLLATDDVVGVLSAESGFGGGSGCDYTGDSDFGDVVLRWVPVNDLGAAGLNSAILSRAVDTTLPGGAMGVVELRERFVVASTAMFTIATVPVTRPFVFWIDPLTDSAYSSDLFDPDAGSTGTPIKVATDYLGDDVRENRVAVGLQEVSVQFNLNRGCFSVDKDGIVGDGIGDIDDTLASWLVYNPTNNRMLVGGLGWAVQSDNSGLVIAAGRAFFRVSESEDGVDWNNDGDMGDMLLFRSVLTACDPTNMGVLNDIAGPFTDAMLTSGVGGAIYIVEETNAGFDVNKNGTIGGFALRSFRY